MAVNLAVRTSASIDDGPELAAARLLGLDISAHPGSDPFPSTPIGAIIGRTPLGRSVSPRPDKAGRGR